jgi:predicted phosphodiesterase
VDAVRYVVRGVRGDYQGRPTDWLLPALGNAAVVVLLMVLRAYTLDWTLALAGGLRIGGTAWNIISSPVFAVRDAGRTALADLGLSDRPEVAELVDRIGAEEIAREPVDRGWIWALVVTLFAIHLGRMGFDRSRLGISSPLFAVIGDVFLALAIAYAIVFPLHVVVRRLTRGVERRAWRWYLTDSDTIGGGLARPIVRRWLERRLRLSWRARSASYSASTALSRGLQTGLPIAAVIAAIVPVFGMSWFFDSENWAAGMWNSWAESRTDDWREAMVRATFEAERTKNPASWYSVSPPEWDAAGDFSFLVIGDPGEGDASQHALRDQVLAAASRDDVRFVVIASDVIYPTDAMKDYERGFWLPMKGTHKPVYAIPGNHDWYDALESFAATFFEPAAARTAMHARIAADNGVTTTTDGRITELIDTAAFYRAQYGVPTGFQRAPFFDVQTAEFALIAIDTGVLRSVDPVQWRWLEVTLEEARGKAIMAVVGHPFYAGGADVSTGDEPFMRLRDLLRRNGASIVMAGDTHDFEYYEERSGGDAGAPVMHHFVNGGGGAYLSFGTALAWPDHPATSRWAFYPRTEQVRSKIRTNMTALKWPLWWWTDALRAWPFSVEWLSAAFDFNVAPFYQSFVEVRVEPSVRRVRVLPYGVAGRLRWSDLQGSADLLPAGASRSDLAEWSVPFR